MVIGFVDIGGIVDHQCLNFLFIIKLCPMNYVYFFVSYILRTENGTYIVDMLKPPVLFLECGNCLVKIELV